MRSSSFFTRSTNWRYSDFIFLIFAKLAEVKFSSSCNLLLVDGKEVFWILEARIPSTLFFILDGGARLLETDSRGITVPMVALISAAQSFIIYSLNLPITIMLRYTATVQIISAFMPYGYHIITYGCQMNKNDSERIATLLDGIGFESRSEPEQADLVLINTCSVRQTAEDRVYGQVHELARLKEKNPQFVLAVTGCMPGRDKDGSLRKKLPDVDFFFPTARLIELPKWLAEIYPEIVNSADLIDDYLKLTPKRQTSKSQAFVTIQTGCNYFCTYCVVPFSRGLERNRPVKDILDEIRALTDQGCVEVTLLGQTVNSFRASDQSEFSKDNPYHDHFAALLWEINQISGIKRIHYTAPHPRHMTDEVIDALSLPNQVNYLHLPVQSGDNEILRKMNRRYTAEQYLEIVDKAKVKRPNMALGTDIIVGFCGESEEQFLRTVDLYKKADFDISYHAMYSPRSGTAGYKAFADDVPKEEKRRRWRVLQDLMEEITLRKNQEFVGKAVEVLAEKCEKKGEQTIVSGNSREMKLVTFLGTPEDVGKIVNVKIEKAREWVLEGQKLS